MHSTSSKIYFMPVTNINCKLKENGAYFLKILDPQNSRESVVWRRTRAHAMTSNSSGFTIVRRSSVASARTAVVKATTTALPQEQSVKQDAENQVHKT